MWETIELREIRVFLALADELHFGRAAERLGVTQSRVSQSLRTLEAKLGERLVHRTSRHVALTAAAERSLADVAPAHERLVAVLRGATQQATLRIGLLASITAGPRLVEVISAVEQPPAAGSVEVKELALSEPFGPLREGAVDGIAGRVATGEAALVTGPVLAHEA